MRFLLSRRWVVLAVVVVLAAYGCYLLGRWQFHRLAETKTQNAIVRHNLAAAPAPATRVLRVGHGLPPDREWRRVRAVGTYDAARSVVVRYQTRQGAAGVDVVTPLRTPSGAVLVDRGWLMASNTAVNPKLPAPPAGRVRVTGWARVNGTGDAVLVADGSTRAISSTTIGKTLPYPLYDGFVDLQSETPAAPHPLVHAGLPGLGDGPHFFYGVQWWFFGVLAVFGFGYLAYDERRKLLSGIDDDAEPDDEADGSQRPEHASVDGQHHAVDEARRG